MDTNKRFKIIAVCVYVFFFGVVALVVYSMITDQPKTCVIKTKEETIIGKDCWPQAGCVLYTVDGEEYRLCGDFKVHLVKGDK